ncbi:MAG: hypothetical protein ACHREM_05255 [Polyangiales bacterium]
MQLTVRVFVVPPPASGAAPHPAPDLALIVESASFDAARATARAKLVASGYRVRSLNFCGTGLIAYVEKATP